MNFLKLKSEELEIDFSEDDFDVKLRRFPFPPYPSDPFILSISRSIPFIVLICFVYLGMQTAKAVAIEKDSGLKVKNKGLSQIETPKYITNMRSIFTMKFLHNEIFDN